jgi:hypothetical protein
MLEQLLRELGSWNPSVRYNAIERAGKLSPDQLVELITMEQRRERRSRPYWWMAISAMIGTLVTAIIFLGMRPYYDINIVRGLIYLLLLTPLPLALLVSVTPASWAGRSITAITIKMDDPGYVTAILTLLARSPQIGETPAKITNLRHVLTRLLPHVTPEQARGWTDGQRNVLTLPLASLADPQYRSSNRLFGARTYTKWCEDSIVLLKALEQIGDGRELATVRKIGELKPRTPVEERLRAAANECIPYLEIRATERDRAQTLLRASGAPDSPAAEILLRPATASGAAVSGDQLLRPSGNRK